MERSIELRQMSVVPGIAHDYWILKEDNKVIGEIHGWPYYVGTNNRVKKTDLPKYFGESDLKLEAYDGRAYHEDHHPLLFRASTKVQPKEFLEKYATQIVLPADKIEAAWNAMRGFEKMFNDVEKENPSRIRYELLSRNSNSLAYSLGVAVGFKEYLDNLNFGSETAGFRMWLHPGWRNDLLPYFSDSPIDTPTEERVPAPLWNQKGLNDMIQEGRAGGRDAVYASYRKTPIADPTRMTPAAARRAIERAKADDAFGKRYVKGERDAVDYLHALHRAAYPEPEAVVGPRVRPDLADKASYDWLLPKHEMSPARRALEAAKSDSGFVNRYLDGDRDAFAHMQSLIRAAYPEPEATGAAGASSEGLAPWSRDLLSTSAGDAEGGSAVGGGFPDWRDELPRRWRV